MVTALALAEQDGAEEGSRKPGALLRALRIERGWTLADVSERTGVQIPTLSKLENGKMSFSYEKLMQISMGLGVDIAELLSPKVSQAPFAKMVGRRSITRAGEGTKFASSNYVYEHVATDLLDKRFEPMVGRVQARSVEEFGEFVHHPGEEFVYVLEGKLELHTHVYAPVLLEEGDSIYFDSDMAHAYIAVSPGSCRILSICTNARDR
jgi:transcriptional regulator with XRE-family HTH domain